MPSFSSTQSEPFLIDSWVSEVPKSPDLSHKNIDYFSGLKIKPSLIPCPSGLKEREKGRGREQGVCQYADTSPLPWQTQEEAEIPVQEIRKCSAVPL